MAKRRDSRGRQNRTADRAFQSGVIDPRAFEEEEGKSFADMQGHYPSEADIEAWEDEETAPDLFAGTSVEDRMQARGGHTQRPGEESQGGDSTRRR